MFNVQQRAKCEAKIETLRSITLVQQKFRTAYGKNKDASSNRNI